MVWVLPPTGWVDQIAFGVFLSAALTFAAPVSIRALMSRHIGRCSLASQHFRAAAFLPAATKGR